MHHTDVIRTSVGIIGNIISTLLFISPAPTFWMIFKNKTTEGLHPYPYLATMMTCILSIIANRLPIINSFGLTMQIIFLAIFFTYTKKKYRKVIGLHLLGQIALVAVIVVVSQKRSLIVGIIRELFRIIMNASSLSIVRIAVKTKSAEFLPVWLCLAGFCNSVCWFSYAFMTEKFDPYLAIGSGIGALFGFIQLSVWLYYTLWGPKKSADSKNKLD